jgi:invasion protein IalB
MFSYSRTLLSFVRAASLLVFVSGASFCFADPTAAPNAAGDVTAQTWMPPEKPTPSGSVTSQAWVKLCDKASAGIPEICRTAHERLERKTGKVLVSVEFWDVVGEAGEKTIFVKLPPGFVPQAGIRLGFYMPEEWALLREDKKVDVSKLKVFAVKPLVCDAELCKALLRIGGAIVKDLKSFAGFNVLAMNSSKQPVAFPVPLSGFTAAVAGPAVDVAKFDKARAKLLENIRNGQVP